ncbi:MAG TPA: hypothetical protein VIG80_11645 [Bacillaceae bacterium]
MEHCLYCNWSAYEQISCPNCSSGMSDMGKIYDYYDDYSPYMDIDLNKLVDGDPASAAREECVHLFQCSVCGEEEEVTVRFG